MRPLVPFALAAFLPIACRAAPERLPAFAEFALPTDWAERSPAEFERWIRAAPALGFELDALKRSELANALEQPGVRALRAAVALGRSQTSQDALLAHLEARLPEGQRADDAASVVAAAALAREPAARERLTALVIGPFPHPDLEVRVECACSALALGATEVAPFLLTVLRIDTFDGEDDERDFTPSRTTAWPRERSAEALSRFAAIDNPYRADASIEDRQAAVRELAAYSPGN